MGRIEKGELEAHVDRALAKLEGDEEAVEAVEMYWSDEHIMDWLAMVGAIVRRPSLAHPKWTAVELVDFHVADPRAHETAEAVASALAERLGDHLVDIPHEVRLLVRDPRGEVGHQVLVRAAPGRVRLERVVDAVAAGRVARISRRRGRDHDGGAGVHAVGALAIGHLHLPQHRRERRRGPGRELGVSHVGDGGGGPGDIYSTPASEEIHRPDARPRVARRERHPGAPARRRRRQVGLP